MKSPLSALAALAHLFFPHTCCGCGSDMLGDDEILCLSCQAEMPFTGFEDYPDNPVERIFWGRLPIKAAAAHLYFTQHAAVQESIHQFKYKGRKDIGSYFGRSMGKSLRQSARFQDCSLVAPLPLHPSKEKKRGYNQASMLSDVIAKVLGIPAAPEALKRVTGTISQTHKNRIARWQNMANKFEVNEPEKLVGQHVLLVDDVVTTGATLEACAATLLAIEGVTVSVAALAYTVWA
ncbi:MAG TPA: phosphoribosyltransferase family protein [Puia sp.]|nr:phosphoribosyltransferase family protein [Puia sp.]